MGPALHYIGIACIVVRYFLELVRGSEFAVQGRDNLPEKLRKNRTSGECALQFSLSNLLQVDGPSVPDMGSNREGSGEPVTSRFHSKRMAGKNKAAEITFSNFMSNQEEIQFLQHVPGDNLGIFELHSPSMNTFRTPDRSKLDIR
jgi:hypothetical protein